MVGNVFADERHLADYAAISEVLPATPGDYVVIATIGYRTDKIVTQAIIKYAVRLPGRTAGQRTKTRNPLRGIETGRR